MMSYELFQEENHEFEILAKSINFNETYENATLYDLIMALQNKPEIVDKMREFEKLRIKKL